MLRLLRADRPRTSPGPAVAASVRAGAWLLLASVLAACGTPAPRPIRPEFDLRHPSATRRLEAVSATVAARDTTQVPALILLLEDDDDGVRLAAGAALRDLTGHDTGYRAFAPPEERARQAASWRAYWAGRAGAGTTPAAPTAPTGPVPRGAGTSTGGYSGGARHDAPP